MPLVVFGLYGGALADVFDRRTILVVTTFGLIVTSALFYLQAAVGGVGVWGLLSLFAVQQAFFAVNQPTRSAILPKLLPPQLLPAANALNMTVFQAGAIAGPLVAGVLIPFVGLQWLYLVDTVTLFATLSAVVRLPRLPVLGADSGAPGVRAVVDGFAYLRHQPVLLMSFVVDLIAMIFGMPRALFPEIADVDFGGPVGGRHGLRAAVRGHPRRRRARRRAQWLGVAGRRPRPRSDRLRAGVGARDHRRSAWRSGWPTCAARSGSSRCSSSPC